MKALARGKPQFNATLDSLRSIRAPADLTSLPQGRLPAWREVQITYNLGNTAQAVCGGLVVTLYHFVPAPRAMASPT